MCNFLQRYAIGLDFGIWPIQGGWGEGGEGEGWVGGGRVKGGEGRGRRGIIIYN